MAIIDLLNFQPLLAPIPGANPAGVNLRLDTTPTSTYHKLKDARNQARAIERSWVREDNNGSGKGPDWNPVLQLTPLLLTEKTKDLEIVAWFIEASIRSRGFRGLSDGFRLACDLVERFWEHLYPKPDEDGDATRVAPLTGLNGDDGDGTLIAPILLVPLTQGSSAGPYSRYQYQQAVELEQVTDPEKRARRVERGAVTLEMFDRAVAETPRSFFQDLLASLVAASTEFDKLCALLEARCGKDADGRSTAPPSSQIRNALRSCRETVEHSTGLSVADLGSASGAPSAANEKSQASATDGAAMPSLEMTQPVTALRDAPRINSAFGTREEAFGVLLTIAQFFRKTEPHSPVSYALEQVVRWGKMPLPQLLTEVLPEEVPRQQLFRLVGIPHGEGATKV